mmetsp:Transcript_24330/g.61800  ORF Transcript_24330/g.61800 Transcript_24330/m.61800 type:complete len:205 (+) Transcript_24330:307-921(+)
MSSRWTPSSMWRARRRRASPRSSRSRSSLRRSCCTASSTLASSSRRAASVRCSTSIRTRTSAAARAPSARGSPCCRWGRATCRGCTRARSSAPSARTSTTRARNAKPTWMAPTSAPPSATSSCRPTGTSCPRRPRRPTSRGYLGSRSIAPPGRALRPRPADPLSPATVPPQLPRRPGVVPRLLPLLGQRSRCWRHARRVLGIRL